MTKPQTEDTKTSLTAHVRRQNLLAIYAALAGFLLPIAAVMAYNYRYDPYQYYRVWNGPYPVYTGVERYEIPGLAKHQDYDTIIVGTSRSQNFTPSMFKSSGWKVLKLTAAGSNGAEHEKIARLALNTGRPRRVIWELSHNRYEAGPNVISQPGSFPNFLYEPSLETPFLYLLSLDVLAAAHTLATGQRAKADLETLNVWYPRHAEKFGANLYLNSARLKCESLDTFTVPEPILPPLMKASISKNLEGVVRAFPNVQFIGYLPPFPLSLVAVSSRGETAQRMAFNREIYALKEKYPNFVLFDFTVLDSVTTKPERYKDFAHYDQAANAEMARIISANDEKYRSYTYDGAASILQTQVRDFEWQKLTTCQGQNASPKTIEPAAGFDQ